MKKVTEQWLCDLENCPNEATHKLETVQVIFTTEQTEGRSIEPYLEIAHLDLCKNCMEHLLKGNYIFAHGAMGHNTYYFK